MIKYQVTDKNGRVHKRTTKSRVYTHCVVAHFAGGTFAEWAGRRDVAENVARRWQRSTRPDFHGVEIIEVAQR